MLALVACGGRGADRGVEPGAGSSAPAPSPPPIAAPRDAGPAADAPAADAAPAAPTAGVSWRCTRLPFAASTPLPEASGAAWLAIDGAPALVAIADSGNHGAYAVIDPDTGKTREQGTLPVAGDPDLEGAAARDGLLVTVTSSGWIETWRHDDRARRFARVDGPYALGPVDLPDKDGGLGMTPPATPGMVCPPRRVNCGRNYEGLCLAPRGAAGRCVGFVAAKADGHLYCLVDRGGRLAVDRDAAIAIARPGVVADCAFGDDGALYAASNTFDLGTVYRVDGWRDPARATVAPVDELAVGFPEVIAARGDVIYRMSDAGGAPSALAKYRCEAVR